MTILEALLIFGGCVAVMVVICLVNIWWRRSGRPVDNYDERQKIAHGEAFQVSMLVGNFYYLVLAILYVMQKDREQYSVEPFLGIFFGIELQAMLYHIYCLLTHSALPLHQKPLSTIISYGALGLLQFANYYTWYNQHGLTPSLTGDGTIQLIYLMCGVFFLFLAAMHLIAMVWKEKE